MFVLHFCSCLVRCCSFSTYGPIKSFGVCYLSNHRYDIIVKHFLPMRLLSYAVCPDIPYWRHGLETCSAFMTLCRFRSYILDTYTVLQPTQNIHLVSMTESRRQWLSGLITPRLSNMPAREHRLRVTQIWNPIAFFTNMFVWKYCMMLCQIGFIDIGLGAQIRPTSFIIKLYNVVFLFGTDERIERICRCLPNPQSSSLEKLQRPGCRLIFYMLHYRWKIQDMDLQWTNDFNIHIRTSW